MKMDNENLFDELGSPGKGKSKNESERTKHFINTTLRSQNTYIVPKEV